MVVSAFPFLNELDLLEYRLRTMAPMVDLFVLMESPVTFSGIPKPLYFSENKERFKQWSIHHLIVDERPNDKLWEREKYQRACLLAEVDRLAPEIVIFSDCDEFVAPDVVQRFRETNHEMMRFDLDMLTFYADRKDSTEWVQGCIQRWRLGLEPELRGGSSPILPKAGWHFEYIGNREILLQKIAAVSHGPEPAGLDFHKKVSAGILDGYERTSPYPLTLLPKPMQDDLQGLADKGWLKNRFPLRTTVKQQRSAFTIVFNGDFCLEQCIENVLPVVDRYVVVEGAVDRVVHLSNGGTSTDGTNTILERLMAKYPNKLVVVSGKWKDKTEMCNAALAHLEPGLLWQIDADEFYHADKMVKMMDWMDEYPDYTEAEFWGYHFFGGFKYHTFVEPNRWGNNPPWRRLFRWNGELWASHTPPRLERDAKVLERDESTIDCRLYHYGYCWDRQVIEKAMYHGNCFQRQQFVEFERVSRGDIEDKALVEFTGQHPINVKEFA